MAKGLPAAGAKRFSIPVFCPTPTDVRIGFFGVSVESDTPGPEPGPATAPAASA